MAFDPIEILDQIAKHRSEREEWIESCTKIFNRYSNKHTGMRHSRMRFNVLWSNINTLSPALYHLDPKPHVERRFKSEVMPIRLAALMTERALDTGTQIWQDFGTEMRAVIKDYLLTGRGTAWIRFAIKGELEMAIFEHVSYKDFYHDAEAKRFDTLTWVARAHCFTRDEYRKRFGNVPPEGKKKLDVFEVWYKPDRKVYWIEEEGEDKVLKTLDDPYRLKGFFPCPRPVYSTLLPDSLIPIPDYDEYEDQAKLLDRISQRIDALIAQVRVIGLRDAKYEEIANLFDENTADGYLAPVARWETLKQGGGFGGAVDMFDFTAVVNALQVLLQAREKIKSDLYEVTGISDIIRGSTRATETATAQQIKSQFVTLRLKDRQLDIQRFVKESLSIMAEVMFELFAPESIVAMSGMQGEQPQALMQAIQIMKSDMLRDYTIDLETDLTANIDEQQEKSERMEFIQAATGILTQLLPLVMQMPQLTGPMTELILFGLRAFRAGRTLESQFEQGLRGIAQAGNPMAQMQQMQQLQAGLMQMQEALMAEQDRANAAESDLAQMRNDRTQKIVELKMQRELKELELAAEKSERESQIVNERAAKVETAQIDLQKAVEIEKIRKAPEGSFFPKRKKSVVTKRADGTFEVDTVEAVEGGPS